MLLLENKYGLRRSKYLRNLRMYYYSPTISLENIEDSQQVGYYNQGFFDIEDDTTSSVQENIIRSCIDTLTSKIASQKVRPFFNTVGGTFKDMQIAKASQEYFDYLYDEKNVNKVISEAFRDACIFDTGVIFIDNLNKVDIERVYPWQVFTDQREAAYGDLTQIAYKRRQYPASLLPYKSNKQSVTYWSYWNIKEHVRVDYFVEDNKYFKYEYTPNELPFIFLHYDTPVKGNGAMSVVDQLYGIQLAIDAIMTKIKDASQLSSPLKYMVPENSDIKVTKLSNRVGEIITYSPIPGQTTPPVMSVTEPFMDPQWIETIAQLKNDAYELVGITQMSATGQKPKGLDSGVALSTMEDIEDNRFEVQLNNIIRCYVDLAKKCIAIFDPKSNVLPETKTRSNIKWKDVVRANANLKIQFSAAESLSKDPSIKLQQLQSLAAAGLIPQGRIAQLMELPDLQTGYSFSNNAENAVMTVIDDCVTKDVFEVPDYVPFDMLKVEITNTVLSLKAANRPENNNDINKLLQLYSMVDAKMQEDELSAETDMANTQAATMEQLASQIQSGQCDEQTLAQAQALLGNIQN